MAACVQPCIVYLHRQFPRLCVLVDIPKPFIAIGNRKRGLERFHSLFGKFGLDDRLIYDINGYTPDLLKRQIDWSGVAAIFDEDRKRAVDCLSSVLY